MWQTPLHNQCVGFLNTPPLWIGEQFGIRQFNFPKLDLSEFVPSPVPKNIRLGHQMEYVFKQLIDYAAEYEVVLYNLPVKNGNRTIGEIDFIVKEVVAEKLIHVELTYKFYIIDPQISEPVHRLMGPNKRDMFYTKMEKIKNAQFELLHSKMGDTALSNHGLDHHSLEHQACYKAQLFTPFAVSMPSIRPLNKACLAGYWLRFDDFNTAAFSLHQFYLPFKSQWVIAPHGDVPWQDHFKILMEINLSMLKENAPMIWMKKSETEFEKFFVVWW